MAEPTQPGGLAAASFTPVNPAGMTPEDVGSQMDILKTATESLAQRYDNPNWFNVAAGFLKPQLGGFAASLGSASQAMGENLEKQRANILPVSAMRAELGRLGSVQKQKVAADKLVADFVNAHPNEPIPSNIISETARLDPNGPAYAGALAKNTEITRLGEQQARTVSTGVAQAAALTSYSPDLYKALPVDPTNPAATTADADKLRTNLEAAYLTIPGVDPKTASTMTIEQLRDRLYSNEKTNAEKSFADKDVAKNVVSSANSNLDDLASARTIVDKPTVARLLGTTAGTGVIAAALDYAKSGTLDNGAKLNKAFAQIASMGDQTTYDDFQVLTKVMMRNVAMTRSAMQNPSVSSTDLAALTNPSASNTAPAIRKIYDLMAHEESAKGREAMFMQGYSGKPNDLHRDDDWKKLKNSITQERRRIAGDSAKPGVPSYYSLYAPSAPEAAPEAAPAGAATVAKSAPTASDIAYARAHPEVRQRFIDKFGMEP